MKTTHSSILSVLATVALLASGCSSKVDLAGDKQTAENGGAGGGGSSGSGGEQTSGGGAGGALTFDGGGAVDLPLFCDAPTCTALELRSYGAPDRPNPLSPGDEIYDCFGYHVTDGVHTHVTAIAPLIDDTITLHDMEFYRANSTQVGANYSNCGSAAVAGTLIYAWNPGTTAESEDFELPPGDFILRVHRVNATDHPLADSSGVSLCACEP
ncbi:MAG TPA: hypothetical protein VHE30_30175 [Polyangiaceae bacterium]|nr:hypothetical protein [Polyangiaceae bacterium]